MTKSGPRVPTRAKDHAGTRVRPTAPSHWTKVAKSWQPGTLPWRSVPHH